MEITFVKDITYLAIAIGTTLISIIGIWFHFKHKLETHEKLLQELNAKIEKRTEVFGGRVDKIDGDFNNIVKSVNQKLNIIEKNLVLIMATLDIKPAADLFEE